MTVEECCGFCLTDCNQERLWKCARCSWMGHPSCWLMLRQEMWKGSHTILHNVNDKMISPWKMPTARCPQCRDEIVWDNFMAENRLNTNLCNSCDSNTCWICHETLKPEDKNKRNSWKCSGNKKCHHEPVYAHWKCLTNWSGHGTCFPECVLCGNFPYHWKKQYETLQNWQNQIVELTKIVPLENFYHLFFNKSLEKCLNQTQYKLLLMKYTDFLNNGVAKMPERWWVDMFLSSTFIFEQMKVVISALFSLPEDFCNDIDIVNMREKLIGLLDILSKSRETILEKYPALVNMKNIYFKKVNRISTPLPGQFVLARWVQTF